MWNGMTAYRIVEDDDEGMKHKLRKAYKEGREDGWREAMEEARRNGQGGFRNESGNGDSYRNEGGYRSGGYRDGTRRDRDGDGRYNERDDDYRNGGDYRY